MQAIGSSELGSAVHAALASWHVSGGALLGHYTGPEAGREMLSRYLTHPLAAARTLAVEVGFNMRIGATRVRGLVDRICELDGKTVLVDFKTNASLDATLIEAYSVQLRLYGLAARRGLVPEATSRGWCVRYAPRRDRDVAPDDAGRTRSAPPRTASLPVTSAWARSTLNGHASCARTGQSAPTPESNLNDVNEPLEERYFERRQIREAIAFAEEGGIAIHRNFDYYHGSTIRGMVREKPFLHVDGLRPLLAEWGRRH